MYASCYCVVLIYEAYYVLFMDPLTGKGTGKLLVQSQFNDASLWTVCAIALKEKPLTMACITLHDVQRVIYFIQGSVSVNLKVTYVLLSLNRLRLIADYSFRPLRIISQQPAHVSPHHSVQQEDFCFDEETLWKNI